MSALEQARSSFDAADYRASRAAALEGLQSNPDDPELLRIAGRAGVELAEPDAVDQLRRVVELRPDDAVGWHDLGDALAAEGRTEEANDAFRRAVELNPDDELALTHLGHTAYATGQADAVELLEAAASRTEGRSSAVISLVEMYRAMGQPEEALAAAQRLADASPQDTLTAIDVAELSLDTGRVDEAVAAFERVRGIDELPGHEVYALHGMILAELRRGEPGRALELAREAATIDTRGRSAGVLAFLAGEEDAPTREEVETALSASLGEHRRAHAEDRRLEGEGGLG